MGKYFGTDGFRGEANVVLTADHAYRIGRFLGAYYTAPGHRCRVVIGKDTRRSSYMFEYAIVAGLTASGADAYLLHVTTTPSVSYVARMDGFDCGVMISASHNPYEDNGIKLLNRHGEKMEDAVIDLVEAYLDGTTEKPLATGADVGRIIDYVAGRNRYVGYLISLAAHSFRQLRIGLDCANGSAWMIARSVFEALGAEVHLIHAEPDGLNINLGAGSTHIEDMRHLVTDQRLDCGFAFDGDADRCIAVDEKGNVVTGDHILYIFGRQLKAEGHLDNNTVVTTVMSNFGLYRAFDAAGIDTVQTKVGDRYVYECMVQNGHCVGGEQSGHIILSKYATTGDGLVTAIKLVEAMLERKMPLSRLYDGLHIYPQVLRNVRLHNREEALASTAVRTEVAAAEEELGTGGRILLRLSGTEPVVRVMVESESEETCRRLAERVCRALESADKADK